jgi:hypothetical protein
MLGLVLFALAVSLKRNRAKPADDQDDAGALPSTEPFTQALELPWGTYVIIQVSLFLFYMANPHGNAD